MKEAEEAKEAEEIKDAARRSRKQILVLRLEPIPGRIVAGGLNRLRKNSNFCHSEAHCAPRNLSFPAFKRKRDSSLCSE